MAVYTRIDQQDLASFLDDYAVGALTDWQGISDGIENTNYFVFTEDGEFVLTLFEKHGREELSYFLDLMAFLAEAGIPCAHPGARRDGRYLGTLAGKPAALVQRLPGSSIEQPAPAHCAAIGEVLARLHIAGRGFGAHRDNDRGPAWWKATSAAVTGHIDPADRQLLEGEMAFQSRYRRSDIPRGVIHADLFRDNALFVDSRLTGIIDFYYACNDALLYDLAVTVNDWCTLPDGALDDRLYAAMIDAYVRQRPVAGDEAGLWPVMLRAAALRFWLSRLHDLHFPRSGELTQTKDPDEFRRILVRSIEQPPALEY